MKLINGAPLMLAALAFGCGNSGGTGKPCNSSADCPIDQICNLGVCGTNSAGGGSATGGGTNGGGSGGGIGNGGGSGTGGGSSCTDNDGDGFSTCGTMAMNGVAGTADCDDNNPNVHPGAMEVLNGVDDDCDGIIDDHIDCHDYDMDGFPYCASGAATEMCNGMTVTCDCNDNIAQIGPNAVEDPTNGIDDNCNGQTDEMPTSCDSTATTNSAADFAKAIGLCSFVKASNAIGNAQARSVRANFGDNYHKIEGDKMGMLSSGLAVDQLDMAGYEPQPGHDFGTSGASIFWTPPKCANMGDPGANDVSEIDLTLQVPQNAQGFTFNFAFFSAEYPEFVCTSYNDRFIVLSNSAALDPTKLPADQCKNGVCNISYDMQGQPVTVNNGFFTVCDGTGCTTPSSKLSHTGYSDICSSAADYCDGTASGGTNSTGKAMGGSTGWLGTTAPAKPNETLTLKFVVHDEADGILDSAALIDNFKWVLTPVTAPMTVVPPGLN